MKNQIKNYISSFKLNKSFFYIFLVDTISFSLIFASFYWFVNFIQAKSVQMMQGRSPEQLQQLLSSSNIEQILPFMQELRYFLLWALLFLIVAVAGSWIVFSFSQKLIWNYLLEKKTVKEQKMAAEKRKVKFWRWNLLNLSLIFPLAIFGVIYLAVKLVVAVIISLLFRLAPKFSLMYPQFVQTLISTVNNLASFYLVLLMVLAIFLVYYAFAAKYKVWDSIGEGFRLFKEKWRSILWVAFFAAITALAITLITIPLRKIFIYMPFVSGFVNLVLASLFFVWLRLYLLRVVHGHQ